MCILGCDQKAECIETEVLVLSGFRLVLSMGRLEVVKGDCFILRFKCGPLIWALGPLRVEGPYWGPMVSTLDSIIGARGCS